MHFVNTSSVILIFDFWDGVFGISSDVFVSSEGALYVILPYDYQAQHPLFEHTPVLNNNFDH